MSGSLRHYSCGSVSHQISSMFHGGSTETRVFPAGAFLYRGPTGRRVLFDTGYAPGRWKAGWRGTAYRFLFQPRVAKSDDLALQLYADGFDPESVTDVVLSHLHPDHIGGVRRFPNARFIFASGVLRTLAQPRLRSGFVPALLPEWFAESTRLVLDTHDFSETRVGGVELRGVDLFGDGSYVVVDLPGHAHGHLGALVEGRILLAGDAAWGRDLLRLATRMKTVPCAIQHDLDSYRETTRILERVIEAGIRVICSHDPLGERELLA